jgi:hypothetical protein
MSAPTRQVRALVYERDGHRCITCGTGYGLTVQHRQATGMGGRVRRPTPSELVTACLRDNQDYERHLQQKALQYGIKVRRNIGGMTVGQVPVYYVLERAWYLLDEEGGRTPCLPAAAAELVGWVTR